MIRIVLSFLFILLISCVNKPKKNSVNTINTSTSVRINNILGEKGITSIDSVQYIEIYAVHKELIPESDNEYYNKLEKLKQLNPEETRDLAFLLAQDSNYNWDISNKVKDFDLQFILRTSSSKLTLLYDSNTRIMGMADLNGLILINVKDSLHQQLITYEALSEN